LEIPKEGIEMGYRGLSLIGLETLLMNMVVYSIGLNNAYKIEILIKSFFHCWKIICSRTIEQMVINRMFFFVYTQIL
jgi:hypothetical protein